MRDARPKHPPGWAPPPEAEATGQKSKNQKKNEARRKKKAEAAAAAQGGGGAEGQGAAAEQDSPANAAAKKVKGLKKKLKQIDDLESKIQGGYEPNDEQRDKLRKRGEVEASLQEAEELLASLQV